MVQPGCLTAEIAKIAEMKKSDIVLAPVQSGSRETAIQPVK
jgi:hypothetical protein